MAKNNDHPASIPDADLANIENQLKQILATLAPYKTPLTGEERRELSAVGDKTMAFLEKGKEYVELYPELMPAWSNKDEFLKDLNDVLNLTAVKNLAEQVVEALFDIFYVAGNEAYHWMLDYYHSAKQAAHRNVPNAKLVVDDMGTRFENYGKPKPPKEQQ